MATLKHLQNPTAQRILGALTLLIGIAATALGYNNDIAITQDRYTLHAQFQSAEGLNVGSEVVLAGITVGEISSLQLDDGYNINVAMQIQNRIRLPQDSSAAIVSTGIFGEKYMRITPGGFPIELQNNDEFLYVTQPLDFAHLLQSLIGSAEARVEARKSQTAQ